VDDGGSTGAPQFSSSRSAVCRALAISSGGRPDESSAQEIEERRQAPVVADNGDFKRTLRCMS
jgi:hypothetical protein